VVLTTAADLPSTPIVAPPVAPPTGRGTPAAEGPEGPAPAAPAEAPPAPGGTWFLASLAESARGVEVTAERLRDADVRHRPFGGGGTSVGRPRRPAAGLGGTSASRTAELIVDATGTVAGVRFDGPGLASGDAWRLRAILDDLDAAVPFAALTDRAVAKPAEAFVHAVRLAFRAPTHDDVRARSSAPRSPNRPRRAVLGARGRARRVDRAAALPPTWRRGSPA
jgi:hypothetical protein